MKLPGLRAQRGSCLAVLALVTLSLAGTSPALAQFAVFDGANLAQNILIAARTLQTTVNQSIQIANEAQMLANEARNLKGISPGTLTALLTQFNTLGNQLTQNWAGVNGLASNVNTQTARYNQIYPNNMLSGTVTTAQMLTETQQQLTTYQQNIMGLGTMTGTVGSQLSTSQGAIANILTTMSNLPSNSEGNVAALQSIGQIQGQMSAQIAQTNALLMALNQAQMASMANDLQDRRNALSRSVQLEVPAAASAVPAAPYLP